MKTLLDIAAFKKAEKAKPGSAAGSALFRVTVGEPKAFDESRRAFRFCFSDSGEDRMTDTIEAKGWQLNNFLKCPTALFAHDSGAPPVGRATNVMIEDSRLMGDIEFASADIYPFADTIYKLVAGKFLNAVSVGFLPLEYDWADDDDARPWGMDFTSQELLEISVVPVPANPRALIDARAKGIDLRPLTQWAEKLLDDGGKVMIPRKTLENLRKAAKEPPMSTPRRAPRRRADDPMAETDPADGGAAVGNCGRPIGEECGMKNVAECSIHGQQGAGMDDGTDTGDEDKRLTALIAKAVRAEIAKAFPKGTPGTTTLRAISPRRRDAADGDPDDRPDLSEEHEKCIRMCSMHMKAMGDALDVAGEHHERAMDALDTVKEALDASPPPTEQTGDPEAEKSALAARLAEIRARVAA